MKELTPKEKIFADEYLLHFNGAAAARAAGYSQKNANQSAKVQLAKSHIQAYLKDKVSVRDKSLALTRERLLEEVARISFFDPRKLYDEKGRPIPMHELDDDTAACIAGVDIVEEYSGFGKDRVFIGYTKKYKVVDKNAAISNGMRHLGMLKDRIEHSGPGGGPIITATTELSDSELVRIIEQGK